MTEDDKITYITEHLQDADEETLEYIYWLLADKEN